MSEVRALLDKAARSFNASEMLLGGGDADFAASRTYYGFFYVAEALLLHEGYSFSRHSQVVGQYGRVFAKTDQDRRFHRALTRAFSIRTAADHSTNQDLGAATLRGLISEGRAFLVAACDYLERREAEDAGS